MIVGITGHRPNKLGNDYDLTSPLILKIKKSIILYINHVQATALVSGMALGIDTLFANIAIEMSIPLIAAIPDASQADRWPKQSQTIYYRLLDKALRVVNVSGKTNFKIEHLQLRNIWIVESVNTLIGVHDGSTGGTFNCLQYAALMKRHTYIINPNDFL